MPIGLAPTPAQRRPRVVPVTGTVTRGTPPGRRPTVKPQTSDYAPTLDAVRRRNASGVPTGIMPPAVAQAGASFAARRDPRSASFDNLAALRDQKADEAQDAADFAEASPLPRSPVAAPQAPLEGQATYEAVDTAGGGNAALPDGAATPALTSDHTPEAPATKTEYDGAWGKGPEAEARAIAAREAYVRRHQAKYARSEAGAEDRRVGYESDANARENAVTGANVEETYSRANVNNANGLLKIPADARYRDQETERMRQTTPAEVKKLENEATYGPAQQAEHKAALEQVKQLQERIKFLESQAGTNNRFQQSQAATQGRYDESMKFQKKKAKARAAALRGEDFNFDDE